MHKIRISYKCLQHRSCSPSGMLEDAIALTAVNDHRINTWQFQWWDDWMHTQQWNMWVCLKSRVTSKTIYYFPTRQQPFLWRNHVPLNWHINGSTPWHYPQKPGSQEWPSPKGELNRLPFPFYRSWFMLTFPTFRLLLTQVQSRVLLGCPGT